MSKTLPKSFQGLPSEISNNQESLRQEEDWLEEQKNSPRLKRWVSL